MAEKRDVKIGFIHNSYPVLSQTFISKEMLGLQELGLSLNVYSLFHPQEEQEDRTYPLRNAIDYLIPTLSAKKLIGSHVYFALTKPLRYVSTLFLTLKKRQSKTSVIKLLLTVARKKETSKEQRQDLLLHFLLAPPLAKKMQNDGVTFVNSHFADAAASFAMLTAKLLKLDYAVTTHAYDIFTPQYNLQDKLKNARFVLTCTNYNKAALQAHESGIDPHRIKAIYHGIDTSKFERQNRPDNKKIELLSVGRLVPKKGFDILIQACAQLRDLGFEFTCRIVGDGPIYGELARLIDETRLHDEVKLIGALPSDEIKAFYERADIFVLPCVIEDDGNRDGIPNVIAEAMAMELPVVSSNISGIPELVEDGVTGYLTEQRDVDAVVQKLDLLLREKTLRREMGQAARIRVKSVFDSKVCLQNLYDFYMKELATSRKASADNNR